MSNDTIAVGPGFDSTDPRSAELVAAIQAIRSPLCDPAAQGLNPGLPSKPCAGTCRLCGRDDTLTFEHVPPRAAGNRDRRRGVDGRTALQMTDPTDFPSSGWTAAQRGSGGYVLCQPCNNWAGANLVPSYVTMADSILAGLSSKVHSENGIVYVPAGVDLTPLGGFELGAVVRQALISLLAISGGAALTRRWPRLAELAMGAVGPLPPEVSIGLTLVLGGRSRLLPLCGLVNPDGTMSVLTEVAHQPFAWTLNVGRPATKVVGTDVSDWLLYAIDEQPTVNLSLSVGAAVTAVPGDYRDPSTVQTEATRAHGG